VLADQLSAAADPAAQAELAGRRWAAAVDQADLPAAPATATAALQTVSAIMEKLGFEPVADEQRILLRRCPFADLAQTNRPVICGVHLGMLRQTFESIDAPVTVKRLDPLVQADPLLCVAHLTERPRNDAEHVSEA
jgi:predicted ArsR family transcriptional regulator